MDIKKNLLTFLTLFFIDQASADSNYKLNLKHENAVDSTVTQGTQISDKRFNSYSLDYEIYPFRKAENDAAHVFSKGKISTSNQNVLLIPYLSLGFNLFGLKSAVDTKPDLVKIGLAYGFGSDSSNVKDEIKAMPKKIFAEFDPSYAKKLVETFGMPEYTEKIIPSSKYVFSQDRGEENSSSKEKSEDINFIKSVREQNFLYDEELDVSWDNSCIQFLYNYYVRQGKREIENTAYIDSASEETEPIKNTDSRVENFFLKLNQGKNIENIILGFDRFRYKEQRKGESKTSIIEKKSDRIGALTSYKIKDHQFSIFGMGNSELSSVYSGMAYNLKTKIGGFDMNNFVFITNANNYEEQLRYGIQLLISKDENVKKEGFNDMLIGLMRYKQEYKINDLESHYNFLGNDLTQDTHLFNRQFEKLDGLTKPALLLYSNKDGLQENIGLYSVIPFQYKGIGFNEILNINHDFSKKETQIKNGVSAGWKCLMTSITAGWSKKNPIIATETEVSF